MESEGEFPPPYSEVDPLSPTTDSGPQSAPLTSPSHISLRGGYIRGVPFHEDPDGPSYFQERGFEFRPDLPLIVVDQDITPDTVREHIKFPTQVDATRGVTQQDWQTFINYVLTELGNETPNTKKQQKTKLTPEEFSERQSKIEAVVSIWNEGFFQPRSIKFIPHFYYNRPPSPSPSYRTVNNAQGTTLQSQPASAPIYPHHLPPSGPIRRGGSHRPAHETVGRRESQYGPFNGVIPFGGGSSRAGGLFWPGGFGGRGWGGSHHARHAHRGGIHHGGPPAHRGRPHDAGPHRGGSACRSRSVSSSSSSSSSSDSDSDDEQNHHNNGFRGRGMRRGFGERRGRRRHRGDRHHHGGRHRSSSTSSSSSSSSDSSIGSFSSDDLAGADMSRVRASFANFQLDPTDRRQHRAAYRQLRNDLRSQQREVRSNKTSLKREITGLARDQRRDLKSELRNLGKEVKRKRKEAKAQYKAARKEQKKARKAAKKAGKRRASEPSNRGQIHDQTLGEQSRGFTDEQQIGTTRGPPPTIGCAADLPTYDQLEKEQSRELKTDIDAESFRRETRRKAKDLDRQVRDLKDQVKEYSRQIDARLEQFEQQSRDRVAEADRQANTIEREAEEQANDLRRKGDQPFNLQSQASTQANYIRTEAERINAQEQEKCTTYVNERLEEARKPRELLEVIAAQAEALWDSLDNVPRTSRSVPEQSAQYGGYMPGAFSASEEFVPVGSFGAGAGPSVRVRGVGFGTNIGRGGEAFGRSMEAWGNRFGRNMEAWGERFGRRMEEQGRAIEKRFT